MMGPSDHAHLGTVVNKSFTPCIVTGLALGCESFVNLCLTILCASCTGTELFSGAKTHRCAILLR